MSTTLPDRIDTTDRLPGKLSPSRAKDYQQCPKLFYYKTILGIATPPTIHTLKGNVAHIAFERLFDHDRQERTAGTALSYIEPAVRLYETPFVPRETVTDPFEVRVRDHEEAWSDDTDLDSAKARRKLEQAELNREVIDEVGRGELVAQARTTTEGYFKMEDPTVFDPAEREVYLHAKAAGVSLHGFIDRLDRIPDREGNLRYVVTDYKTGKPPTSDRFASERFFQLKVYALLLRTLRGETPALLRLVFTSGADKDAIEKLHVTDDMLDRTAQQLKALWRAIQDSARRDRWPTRRGPLCDWCHFQDICPEFNDGGEQLLPQERELRQGLLA